MMCLILFRIKRMSLEHNFKWWKDPTSKADTNTFAYPHSRADILSNNPYYGELINFNENTITLKSQDDSPQNIGDGKWIISGKEVYYFQRPYIKFLLPNDKLDEFIKQKDEFIDHVYIYNESGFIKNYKKDNINEIMSLKFYVTVNNSALVVEKEIQDELALLSNTLLPSFTPVLIISHKMPKIGLRDYFLPRLLKYFK